MFPQEAGVFSATASHHGYVLRIEALGQDLQDHIAGMGGIGAGLYYGSIACGQSVYQRRKSQHERVVPGAHDQCYAIRGWLFKAAGMKLSQRSPHVFFRGKTGGYASAYS